MSLTGNLNSALSGMNAAQRAMTVTSNNVANVNTEGYSRKVSSQTVAIVDGRGLGVRTEEATRIVDEYLSVELRNKTSELGRTQVVSETFERIQDSIIGQPGETNRGIPGRLAALVSSIETLANAPESIANKNATIGTIDDLVTRLQDDSATVQNMRKNLDNSIAQLADEINNDLDSLQSLNGELARSRATPELLDERDRILARLSENIEISITERDNNTIAVYTAEGHSLLESSAAILQYPGASSVGDRTTFSALKLYSQGEIDADTGAVKTDPDTGNPYRGTELVSAGVRATLTPELIAEAAADPSLNYTAVQTPITEGRLAGLLEARDEILPDLADQLNELGQILQFNLNAAHNQANSQPLPIALEGSVNDRAGAYVGTGQAYMAIVDANGDVVQDITIDVGAAGSGAALAAQINTSLGAFGSASIDPTDGNLEITLNNADPANPTYRMALSEGEDPTASAISLTDNAGHNLTYGFSHYFGLNDLIVANPNKNGAAALSVRSDIAANGGKLSSAVLDIGDTADLTDTRIGGIGDNRGFQRLAEALEADFTSVGHGGIAASNTNLTQYAADLVAVAANDAAKAEDRNSATQALVDDISLRASAVSGVNLDEELANLILYQQAYSASARIITVTNELFDELLSIAR